MADLSPAAQAMINAADEVFAHGGSIRNGFAAALRALDSQLGHEVLNVRCVDCSQIELIAAELEGNHPESPDSSDGPAVSDDREPASVTDQITAQLHRRASILFVRKVIDRAIRDTASVHWRVADTGEQLVRATDLLRWAEHMEKQMEQLDD